MKITLAVLIQSSRGSGALAADVRFPSRITGCGSEPATPEVTYKTRASTEELLMGNDHQCVPESLRFVAAGAAKQSQHGWRRAAGGTKSILCNAVGSGVSFL